MKKSILLLVIVAAASCSAPKKEDAMAGKKIVCDSVATSAFDANGNEILTKTYMCDTVPDTK